MKPSKRILCLLLIFALAVSVSCMAADSSGFSDVPSDAWYADAVDFCLENGLMDGVSSTEFSPNGSITRAMLVTALYRRAGTPKVDRSDNFSDIEPGEWYSDAVIWAFEQGIIEGCSDSLFGTNDPVTREQLVTILYRIAGEPAFDPVELFADQADISSYAVSAAAWARANGIISGKEGNRFDPRGTATRAETAAVLMNQTDAIAPAPTPAPTQAPQNLPSFGGLGGGVTPPPSPSPDEGKDDEPDGGDAKILIAYFSATGNTENIANHIKTALGDSADVYEILPEIPYTSDDLNYRTDCRANREQNDPDARPAIGGDGVNIKQYDVVFIGYPIWHGRAPKIIYTFLESYDFGGKTVIPFCTSASSPYNDSGIRDLASDTSWLTGRRFGGSAPQSSVADWVSELDILKEESDNTVYIQVSGVKNAVWTAALADNSSADALKALLAEGDITVSMHDYSSFEKVGPLPTELVRNDERISTEPGDIILYQGNQLTIYYDTNTWSFTRLGKVNNVSQGDMLDVFGSGDVTVTLSLSKP